MKNLIDTSRTLARLGLSNVVRVALYRLSLKSPLSAIRKLTKNPPQASGPFFHSAEPVPASPVELAPLFGYHKLKPQTEPPAWLSNPLSGYAFKTEGRPFWAISDFDPNVGDIKQYWEMSRFGWAVDMARAVQAGETAELARLNNWLEDWLDKNPPYQGPNWKCGQEASIRVLHLLVSAILISPDGIAAQGLQDLIALHLERISPTVSYAKAQDNNHGTSEAAALFVGGSFLQKYGHPTARKWAVQGRRLLENRVLHLIAQDGSFSQHSVNYHRMMLDSLSICEWWRQRNNLPAFTDKLHTRAKAASTWLYRLTDGASGDVPNMGANDGAHLLNLFQGGYRDYRPSVSLAYALWYQQRAYDGVDICERHLEALQLAPQTLGPKHSDAQEDSNAKENLDTPGIQGGFAVKSREAQRVILRHPRFRFRPSQSDALHLDVWYKGENILRDGGTYSYNSGDSDLAYFGGTASHNTVEFDGRDQMPRLGRFLFGSWLKTRDWDWTQNAMQAGYQDSFGAKHTRRVELQDNGLDVMDHISAYRDEAALRWRFAPNLSPALPRLNVSERAVQISLGAAQLTIEADAPISAMWETGFESRFYLLKTELPVLKISMKTAKKVTTKIRWIS